MAKSDSPQEFIVQGEAVRTGGLADHLSSEPDVTQIAQVSPDVVVLSMTKTQADRLKAALSDVVVEPNAELKPFDAGQI
ncbi:MAG: hypothetical protein HZA66_09420 [Rhodopseudomonas palustris]|uniref:Uncharacterized protein n=1 Tax=Rhodopseudomonas palustris TaxID=1076 RepID=A0A933VUB0_RHOPL|nr:hypothetical protein [Rhodopseudomonas palustris]